MSARLCKTCRSSGWLRDGVRCHCNPAPPEKSIPESVIRAELDKAVAEFQRANKGRNASRGKDRAVWEEDRAHAQGRRHALEAILKLCR